MNPRRRWMVALAVCGVSAWALAEDVWVQRVSLPIRSGKGAAYEAVTEAKKGDKLTVLAHEDKWLKVSLNGKIGYVYESAISTREVAPQGARIAVGKSGADPLAAEAAGKGLEPDAVIYASAHNMSSSALTSMIAMRNAVTGVQWVAFEKEGNVGLNRKGGAR
ncbi:MAG: SH3 domain-containing protein [Tepidisphaeraceae bacterium]